MFEVNDSNSTTTTLPGGAIRVSMGAPRALNPAPAPVHQSTRVGGGVTSIRFGGESSSVTQHAVTHYRSGQDVQTNSVMATLQRDHNGESVELIPGVRGTRTHLAAALRDGLIVPVGNGHYRDAGPAGPSEPTAATASPSGDPAETPQDPGAGVFDPGEDAAWAADIAPLPSYAYNAALASVSVAVMSGADNLDRAASQLAGNAAIDPALAANYVQQGHAMYERVVARAAAEAGVQNKEAFYTWMRQHKGNALRQAVGELVHTRNVSVFRTLAAEYNRRQ